MSDVEVKNYPTIRAKLVNKKDALRVKVSFTPLEKNRELTIYWPVSDDKWMEQCLRFLDEFGSSTGNSGDTWVDDPVASDEVYMGRWRIIENRLASHPEQIGVYQVLREGLLRELPASEESDTETKLTRDIIDPQNGMRQITRFWENVDPNYYETIIAAREAVKTRTNPTVREQPITGLFAVSQVYADPMPNDGAVQINEVLTEIKVISAVAGSELTTLAPTIRQKKSTKEFDTAVISWTNVAPSSRTYLLETITDATIIANITTLFSPFTGTWVYSDRDFAELKDNTATFTVTIKKVSAVTKATDLASIPSVMTQDNEILQQFSTFTGELDSVAVVWTNISLATTTRKFLTEDLLDAALIAEVVIIYPPLTGTWTYFDRQFKEGKDNTGNFSVLMKQVAWTNYNVTPTVGLRTNTRLIVSDTNKVAGKDIRQTDIAEAIPLANINTVRASVAAESGFVVDSVSMSDNKNGSASLQRNQTKIQTTVNTAQIYHRYTPEVMREEETETYQWINITNASAMLIMADAKSKALSMSTATYQPASAGHVLRYVANNDKLNGLSDVTRETFKPRGGGDATITEAYFETDDYDVVKYIYKVGGEEYKRITWKKWMGCSPTQNDCMTKIRAKVAAAGACVKGSDRISKHADQYYIWEVTLSPTKVTEWLAVTPPPT